MKPWFWLAALLLTIAGNLQAQELTHPTRMGLPDSDFTRPDPADFQLVLDNGLIAYVAEASQVPLVTMSAFIRVGKIDDAQQGAAEALLDVLVNSGPANSSPAEYRAMLDAMAAEYTVRMHDEWTEISWDEAIQRIARRIKDTRDRTFQPSDLSGRTVNRAPGIAMVGGCTDANEVNYLLIKAARSLGVLYLENQARI